MSSRILLVEGNDDGHTISHLCAKHDIDFRSATTLVEIEPKEGFEHLRRDLSDHLNLTSDLKNAAIVVDANSSAHDRWTSLRDRLRELGFSNVPKILPSEGAIVQRADEIRPNTVGVWIMPDNSRSGMLEDFLRELIPGDDTMLERAQSFVNGIPAEDRLFSPNHTTKAVMHGWLAVQENPGQRFGLSIKSNKLDAHAKIAQQFINWLRKTLFDDIPQTGTKEND